jgi:hypothetical protein
MLQQHDLGTCVTPDQFDCFEACAMSLFCVGPVSESKVMFTLDACLLSAACSYRTAPIYHFNLSVHLSLLQ